MNNEITIKRTFSVVKIGNLTVGDVFYDDIDEFVYEFENKKRYVEKIDPDGACVQLLKRNGNHWEPVLPVKYDFNVQVVVLGAERIL